METGRGAEGKNEWTGREGWWVGAMLAWRRYHLEETKAEKQLKMGEEGWRKEGFDLIDLINSYTHPTVRLLAESTFNTKLRNPGVRPGSHWVSPRAVSWVWGCRPPSLVVLSSISRRLFQEPCTLGGHLAGSFPPILHPSPTIFIYFSTFISSK
jgi:hypothetical protein